MNPGWVLLSQLLWWCYAWYSFSYIKKQTAKIAILQFNLVSDKEEKQMLYKKIADLRLEIINHDQALHRRVSKKTPKPGKEAQV